MNPRTRSRTVCLPAVALVALAAGGCFGGSHDTGVCDAATRRPLGDGERFNGHDPHEALAPFLGHWHGTLTWRTGAVTGLDLDVPADPPTPLEVQVECGRDQYVFTAPLATVSTEDGAANHAGNLLVNVQFLPDGSLLYNWGSTIEVSVRGQLGPPASDIVNPGLYTNPALRLPLTWNMPAAGPSEGRLIFVGQVTSTGSADSIDLGTVVF